MSDNAELSDNEQISLFSLPLRNSSFGGYTIQILELLWAKAAFVVIKLDFVARPTGFKSQSFCLPSIWLWLSHITPTNLNTFICKWGPIFNLPYRYVIMLMWVKSFHLGSAYNKHYGVIGTIAFKPFSFWMQKFIDWLQKCDLIPFLSPFYDRFWLVLAFVPFKSRALCCYTYLSFPSNASQGASNHGLSHFLLPAEGNGCKAIIRWLQTQY